MRRLLCKVGRHYWGPWTIDFPTVAGDRAMQRNCMRCWKTQVRVLKNDR